MRHLLAKVPKNDEARALLVEALAKQRRYKDAVQALPDNPDNNDALLNLRLTWIEQDPPGSEQVEQWIASSNLSQRVRLWQAYSLSLAKFWRRRQAHDWLAQLAPKGDDDILHLARSNWSEQLRDWNGTIEQLAPLAASKQLDAEGWQRLGQRLCAEARRTAFAAIAAASANARSRAQGPPCDGRSGDRHGPGATGSTLDSIIARQRPGRIRRNASACGSWHGRAATCRPCNA